MNGNAKNRNHKRSLADIFTWWVMLAAFAAAALGLNVTHARAQQTAGPLPAATPSDQPPPPPRANVPKEIGGKPNLSGTWALNKDESDDPREAMREAGGDRGGPGGGGGGPRIGMGGGGGGMGGGGGWGGRGGGNGGGGYGGHRGGQQSGRENPLDDLSTLTIEQTASSASVTSESGRTLAQYVAPAASQSTSTANRGSAGAQGGGGSPSSTPSTSSASSNDPYGQADGASTTPAAQWKGSQLVAVTPGRRQGKTTRTYELSPDGKQLYVTTRIENPRFKSPVTFRLVYDPAPSGG